MTVSIDNLRFAYNEDDNDPILNIHKWSITKGEHVFIHGPSGSGKSTLLNLLAGILVAPSGGIKILDQSLHRMSAHQRDKFRANHIGFVFQQFNLVPYLNVLDNIRLANYFGQSNDAKNTDSQAKVLLQTLGINADLHQHLASKLSIGQQQRVAIARSLINLPELLIVDEPTSALDANNRDAFMALLMDTVKQHNITLIFVSHDRSLERYFSEIVSLQKINTVRSHH